jgi:hypothetical protein
MKRRHKNLGQTTLVLAILGAVFGWSLISQPGSPLYAADSPATADQGLRDPDDIVCLRTEWSLLDEGRTIRAQVSRGRHGEVIIDLADFVLGDGLILASSERTRVRSADSWEPVVMRLAQDHRSIVIAPEGAWGSIHRDTGLELEYEIVE